MTAFILYFVNLNATHFEENFSVFFPPFWKNCLPTDGNWKSLCKLLGSHFKLPNESVDKVVPSSKVHLLIRINRFRPEFSHEAFFSPTVCSWDRPQGASGPTEKASPEETGSRHWGRHWHGHGGAVQRWRPGLQLSNQWSRKPRKQIDGWIKLTQPLGESHSSLVQKRKERKWMLCYVHLWWTRQGPPENRLFGMWRLH